MRIPEILRAKKTGRKLTMLSVYDCPMADIVDRSGVDMTLVGDSLGMVILGYPSTREVTMDEMIHHAKAVRRGVKKSLLIGDLPLKGVERGPRQALESARRFMNEAGCEAVKLEWVKDAPAILAAFRKARIPVMAHVGLTPQTIGAYKVQGAKADDALRIFNEAHVAETEGAFGVLFECVPEEVAKTVTSTLKIPTIGIGSGRGCDGQVLVFHDVAGMNASFRARFVQRYAYLYPSMEKAASRYVKAVSTGKYPRKKHTFAIPSEELAAFRDAVDAVKGKAKIWR